MTTPTQQRINLAGKWLNPGPMPIGGLIAIVAKYLDEFEGTLMNVYDDPVQRARCLATVGNKSVGPDDTAVMACPPAIMADHTDCANFVIVAPTYTVTGTRYNGVRLWNPDGTLVKELCPEEGGFKITRALSNGTFAVSDFNTIWMFGADGEPLRKLEGHAKSINCMLELGSGALATGYHDNTVIVWGADGCIIHELWGHSGVVQALIELPDGRIASGSWDKTIRVWSAEPGCSREESKCDLLEDHTGGVHVLCLISDGRLASGGYDNTVRIWDLGSCECLVILDHTHWVSGLCMIKGTLICGLAGPGIHMWGFDKDLPVHKGVLGRRGGHSYVSSVDKLVVLPNGMLAARYSDGQVRTWI